MPILYEDIFPKPPPPPQIGTFAWVRDSEKTLTLTLAVLAAGKGIITKYYAFDPATGEHITKAAAGQKFGLYLELTNQGETDDCWMCILDKDTGEYIKTPEFPGGVYYVMKVTGGKLWGWTIYNITMPNKQFNILIQAGHGTP